MQGCVVRLKSLPGGETFSHGHLHGVDSSSLASFSCYYTCFICYIQVYSFLCGTYYFHDQSILRNMCFSSIIYCSHLQTLWVPLCRHRMAWFIPLSHWAVKKAAKYIFLPRLIFSQSLCKVFCLHAMPYSSASVVLKKILSAAKTHH